MLEKSGGPRSAAAAGGGAMIPAFVHCRWAARLTVCACLGIALLGWLTSSSFSIFKEISLKDERNIKKRNAVWIGTSKEEEMKYTAGLKAALLGQENVDGSSFVPNGTVVSNISYDLLKRILECETFDAEKFVGTVSEGCRSDFSSLLLSTVDESDKAEDIATVMSQSEQLGNVVEHLERLYTAVHNNSVDCYLETEYECPQDVLTGQSEFGADTRQQQSTSSRGHGSVGIAIVAMIQDEIALQASKKNKIEYAKLHGYPLQFLEGKRVRGTGRPLAWSKVPFLLLQMMATLPQLSAGKLDFKGGRPKLEYIWSLDLDTVITDMRQRIDEAVDPRYDIVISNDPNAINSGSFLLKNSDWTRLFLVTTWLEMDLPKSQSWWENAAIDDMGKNVYISNHIKKVKQSLFNSYERDITADGDGSLHLPFLLHFAGMPTKWIKVIRGCEYVRNNEYLLGLDRIQPDLATSTTD